MLQKTQMSEASTNAEVKTTSFFTSKNRQMYKASKKGQQSSKSGTIAQNSNHQNSNDLLILTPTSLNVLAWPAICLIDTDVTVALKSNYYEIAGLRGKKRFVPRNSQVKAEVVYFWADKPTKKIILLSIERFLQLSNNTRELWVHINLSKYDPQSNTSESADFHLRCEHKSDQLGVKQVWDFCSFQLIDNCRKGLLVVKVLGGESDSHYKILLLDLVDKKKDIPASNHLNLANILSVVQLNCELLFGRLKEKLIKTVKSEFGDIVLLVTNHEVYEIEVEDIGDGLKLNFKSYKVLKSIMAGKGLLKNEEVVGYQHNQEEIVDARFMSNGLKLMLLTANGQVFLTEASNVLAGQNLKEIMTTAQLADKYQLDYFVFEHLFPVNGSIAVEFHAKNSLNLLKSAGKDDFALPSHEKLLKGLLILKTQGNTLSFAKLINLQLDPKELNYLLLRECEGIDEMLVLYIEKKRPEVVEIVKCRILVMQLNAMAKIGEAQYNYCRTINLPEKSCVLAHYQPDQTEKLISSVSIPDVSKTFYLLREKELVCYKMFTDLDIEKIGKEISYLFSYSFFQKPIKITVNPLTLQFAIIFKEFVKFFYFNYYSVKNFFTLKIKNVNEVRYISRGEKVIVVCNDGNIYLVDSYTFVQTKLMDFYGEVSEADMLDERHLLLKSAKHMLCLFRKTGKEDASQCQFAKLYEIKIEDGDLYHADSQKIIVFRKNAFLEVYSHELQQIPDNMAEVERECFKKLHDIHSHLQRRVSCSSFDVDEDPTSLLLTEQLGFVFVATSKGNIKQYLWPVKDPTDPNPPEVLTQHISSHRIISLSLDAKLTHLYVVSENGSISQLQITQIINGQQMPYIYVFSQKTRHLEMQKRQFTDKNFFIDSFTPTETLLTQNSDQIIGELQFFLDKLKDDLDQMTKTAISQGKQEEKKLKIETKSQQKNFKELLKEDDSKYRTQMLVLKSALEQQEKEFEQVKAKEVEQYQKTLLQLYKESDRLNNILKTQNEKMTQEQQAFRNQFEQKMKQLQQEMGQQQSRLEKEYKDIQERRRLAVFQNKIENQEEDAQMQLYKATIHRQEQEQLNEAEERKERLLGENAKREKEINNLKHRANYFENLILQTKVQINELTKDQQEYDRKKKYLQEQLKDKEQIIERIEHELVVYLKNTEDMKTIKNNHQYELQEYEKQVGPINQNHHSIENNVKHMNMEIMNEYTLKVQKIDLINELSQKAEALKEKKKKAMVKKLQVSGKLNRILEQLVYLATHPFDGDVKKELKSLLGDKANEDFDRLDQDKEKQRRQGEKLMRYKNMIRREIEEEEKREEHIAKNQHQYYKYHKESTALVREYNELQKTGALLKAQETKLLSKIKQLKSTLFNTPLRRVPSLSLHKPIAQKKLTPFQRYEEEQTLLARKQQQTTDTKLSRASQSISFLKGLMKEMGQSQSKYEKMQVMRERVRTFVNPELKARGNRNEEIKKILFGRSRMTSEMLKLK